MAPEGGADVVDSIGAQASQRAVAAFLRRQPNLWNAAVVERIYERVVRVARVDLRQATRLAQAAAWLANRLGDDGSRAQSLRAMGHVLLISGKYAAALQRYEAALRLFRALGRPIDVGRTLSGGPIQALISLGRYDRAFVMAKQARQIFERHGEHLRLARLDSNIGNILSRQNRFQDALVLYERARGQLAQIGEPHDVAAVLSNLAVCYTSLNRLDKALETHASARDYYERHGLLLLVAQTDYNIAYLHYLRGEYTRALELYRAAQAQAEQAGDAYHTALCDLDRSEIYLELNLSDEAGELAGRALVRFDTLGMAYEAGKALTNLAIAESHNRHAEHAVALFDAARALFKRERNQVRLAWVDFYQALAMYRDGSRADARRLCRHALRLFTRASMPGKAALCHVLLARLELDAGNVPAAERACRCALQVATRAHAPMLTYQTYCVLGSIREAQRRPRAAYKSFEQARAAVEQLRGHLQGEDQKVAFVKDKAAVYESLVAVGLALGSDRAHQEAAFSHIEQAKSRSLADLLEGSTLAPRVDSDRGDDVRTLREAVNWYSRQIELEEAGEGTPARARIESLRRKMRAAEHALARSWKALQATDAEFVAMQGGTAVGLAEIRAALTPGTILLEYFQARERLYACVLSADRLAVVPLGSASHVRNLLRLLRFQLSKFRLGSGYIDTFGEQLREATEAHLRELYVALVGPVRRMLSGDHLVVVPHGALHHLPFHALFDGASFLIDQFTVSYAPSASVYRFCCMKRTTGEGEPLIMGVPDALTPYIVEEVTAVARLLSQPQVFLGPDATADRLRASGEASRFVHIATHGHFRRDNPMFSSIRLGNGPLNVFDLYQLRLSAELVTLSGCSTGLNAIVGGDELLGLARGLLYAGARTVMLTLWDVNDMSTTEFMKSFYAHLTTGATKPRALQMAMCDVRKRYAHPFHWAPFVVTGDAQAC
jgi:tetratricopeptide (TPR) repeat protein